MSYSRLAGKMAWDNLRGQQRAKWEDIVPKLDSPHYHPTHVAKFPLALNERFFCLGSCFARNIEEHLIYAGERVLSKRIVSPRAEYPGRPNGLVNKFTTHSMLQEVKWLTEPPEPIDKCLAQTASGWIDMHLFTHPLSVPLSLERARERRHYLLTEYFSRLRTATTVILTLGLNEVWHDHQTGMHLNIAPSFWTVQKEAERFSLEITDVNENLDALEQLRSRLKALQPDVRIIVTVSPVPLTCTFQPVDVAVANTLSKATLRAAAEAFDQRHDDVAYFPSYEMVTIAPRQKAYISDMIHVDDNVVAQIVRSFMSIYLGKTVVPPSGYVEMDYLNANPDVDAQVRSGHLESAYEHFFPKQATHAAPSASAE